MIDWLDEKDHETALYAAALHGRRPVVRLLLGAGADPTIMNDRDERIVDRENCGPIAIGLRLQCST